MTDLNGTRRVKCLSGVRKGDGGANEQITIYFSQIHVYFFNGVIYNEYHDYLLV